MALFSERPCAGGSAQSKRFEAIIQVRFLPSVEVTRYLSHCFEDSQLVARSPMRKAATLLCTSWKRKMSGNGCLAGRHILEPELELVESDSRTACQHWALVPYGLCLPFLAEAYGRSSLRCCWSPLRSSAAFGSFRNACTQIVLNKISCRIRRYVLLINACY